jgi:hypothetical protein
MDCSFSEMYSYSRTFSEMYSYSRTFSEMYSYSRTFSEMYSYSRTLSGAALVSIRILANVGPDGTSEKNIIFKFFI